MSDAKPLYLQIRDQLKHQMAAGTLAPGQKLPSSRQLAVDLGVSRITVTNAYAELEADGLVVSRTGSGTYVAPEWERGGKGQPAPLPIVPAWQRALSEPGPNGAMNGPHPWREALIRKSQWPDGRPEGISFARARGDQRLFPHRELRRIMGDVLADDAGSLGYEPPEGTPRLRRVLAQYLRQQGITCTPDEIVITAGSQQAFDLITRALINAGDAVITELPTFMGALESLESRRARVVGVPIDSQGIDPRALERALQQHAPRLMYVIPTFHNPTATVTSAARRREIVDLAAKYGVPVVEDEYLREVRFGSPIPAPLASFDTQGNVIHVGSFSKSLSPAFRLGYVVARGPLRERLVSLKRVTDICCSPVLQRAASEFLESGSIYAHWKRISRAYRKRQEAMIAAVQRHFPRGCAWTAAQGGVVLWVRVPLSVSVAQLLDESVREGVSFAPGAVFFPEPADQPFLRLNYASHNEEEIERGVAVIGRLMHRQMARRGTSLEEGLVAE